MKIFKDFKIIFIYVVIVLFWQATSIFDFNLINVETVDRFSNYAIQMIVSLIAISIAVYIFSFQHSSLEENSNIFKSIKYKFYLRLRTSILLELIDLLFILLLPLFKAILSKWTYGFIFQSAIAVFIYASYISFRSILDMLNPIIYDLRIKEFHSKEINEFNKNINIMKEMNKFYSTGKMDLDAISPIFHRKERGLSNTEKFIKYYSLIKSKLDHVNEVSAESHYSISIEDYIQLLKINNVSSFIIKSFISLELLHKYYSEGLIDEFDNDFIENLELLYEELPSS